LDWDGKRKKTHTVLFFGWGPPFLDFYQKIIIRKKNKKNKKSDYTDLDNWTYLKKVIKIKRNIDLIKIKNKIKINLK